MRSYIVGGLAAVMLWGCGRAETERQPEPASREDGLEAITPEAWDAPLHASDKLLHGPADRAPDWSAYVGWSNVRFTGRAPSGNGVLLGSSQTPYHGSEGWVGPCQTDEVFQLDLGAQPSTKSLVKTYCARAAAQLHSNFDVRSSCAPASPTTVTCGEVIHRWDRSGWAVMTNIDRMLASEWNRLGLSQGTMDFWYGRYWLPAARNRALLVAGKPSSWVGEIDLETGALTWGKTFGPLNGHVITDGEGRYFASGDAHELFAFAEDGSELWRNGTGLPVAAAEGVLVTDAGDVIDATNGSVRFTVPVGVTRIAGARLYVVSTKGSVLDPVRFLDSWDVSTGTLLQHVTLPSGTEPAFELTASGSAVFLRYTPDARDTYPFYPANFVTPIEVTPAGAIRAWFSHSTFGGAMDFTLVNGGLVAIEFESWHNNDHPSSWPELWRVPGVVPATSGWLRDSGNLAGTWAPEGKN